MVGFTAEVEREDRSQASQTHQPARPDELRLEAAAKCQIDCGWHDQETVGQSLRILTTSKGPTESTNA